MIGEFEYLILAAASRLADDAYGAAIAQEIELFTGRRCSLGALYTTLDRLEFKGLIKSHLGDPTPQRGGRSKRMIEITSAGRKAAAEFYTTIATASEGIVWVSGNL